MKPKLIGVDPKSPGFDSLDEASNALAATFPAKGSETAGVVFKSPDGKYRFSTTIPGTEDHFELHAGLSAGTTLAAVVHSHPGSDADGQVFSTNDVETANNLKLPSYVRFLDSNTVRAYRPGVSKTEKIAKVGSKLGRLVARGDPLGDEKDKGPDEWEQKLKKNYDRNRAYAKEDDYNTTLNPQSEAQFRAWIAANKVPFDPKAKTADYDMRGFWLALQSKDPAAVSAVNPYDKQIHYPDRWKTPYHETFSAESQWAKPGAPSWNKDDQLVLPSGETVFDSRKAAAPAVATPPAVAVQPAATPAPAAAPQETDPNASR